MKPSRPVSFVLAATNHGSLIVNRLDYHAVGPTAAYGVGHQLLSTSSHDQRDIDLLIAMLHKRRQYYGDGVVAIDCGANIGVHTIEWSRAMHKWGSVIAVEAQERIFYALAGNITLNNCSNARAVWGAVAASPGVMSIPAPDYDRPASFGSLELRQRPNTEAIGQTISYATDACTPVRVVTIDEICLGRLDLVKIDVEGMEVEALHGATQSVERSRPIIFVEHIKVGPHALANWLEPRGYRIITLGMNTLAVHEADPMAKDIRIDQNGAVVISRGPQHSGPTPSTQQPP